MQSIVTNVWQAFHRTVSRHWKAIQYCFVGLTFLFIGFSLRASWREVSSFNWEVDYIWFTASLVLVSVSVLSLATWWTASLRVMHEPIGLGQGTRIWAVSQLAKYLPGGVWNYVSRVYAGERVGVSKRHGVLSVLVETVLRVQAAIFVFLASYPLWPSADVSLAQLLMGVSLLLLGLIVLNPSILNRGVNLALSLLRRQPVEMVTLKYRHLLALLAGHILSVLGAGAAFYLMVGSVQSVTLDSAVPMAGMLSISVILGFLNPLTPHGLGTREAMLIALLTNYLPLPNAIVVSLLARLWLTISELASALVVTLLFGARGHREKWES